MTTLALPAPARARRALPAVVDLPKPADLFAAWIGRLSPRTRTAYEADLRHFASFLPSVAGLERVRTVDDAIAALLGGDTGRANRIAAGYVGAMRSAGLASATVNRRLSALRSLAKRFRAMGASTVTIDVEGLPRRPYRDTAGPGVDGVRAMLATVAARPASPQRARDFAIVRLLADCGLRKVELETLDVEHVDGDRLWILGKGAASAADRVRVTLPADTAAALRSWMSARGSEPGPLFLALTARHRGRRLTGCQFWRVVRKAAADAGIPAVWPHALRHSGITTASESGASSVELRQFSRHASSAVLDRYIDNRADKGGDLARFVAARHGTFDLVD